MHFHWQVWDLFGCYIAAHLHFHWIFLRTGQQGFQNRISKMFAMSVIILPTWAASRPFNICRLLEKHPYVYMGMLRHDSAAIR